LKGDWLLFHALIVAGFVQFVNYIITQVWL
jgi:hypothetical protein